LPPACWCWALSDTPDSSIPGKGRPIDERIRKLNRVEGAAGSAVIYIMSRDQRADDNHALLAAQEHAIDLGLPLRVVFFLFPTVRHRRLPHSQFMIGGLRDVEQRLRIRGIAFQVSIEEPVQHLHRAKPAAIYTDFSPLRGPRALQERIAREVACPVFEVDTHNIVPAWVTSDKEEYAARTIRPKIHRLLDSFLHEPPDLVRHPVEVESLPETNWDAVLDKVSAPALPDYDPGFTPGGRAAKRRLGTFLEERFADYPGARNDPTQYALSGMSPYLHFGQISSLQIALQVHAWAADHPGHEAAVESYLEELIVRKELSDNYCLYNPRYDSYDGIKPWARMTLDEHLDDEREHLYTRDQLEAAATADNAWNACQIEMMRTGKMHGYMRMYWGKKILEWSEHPAQAIEHAIYLNDTYNLDGCDPNGYTGILWSIGGLHDRAWAERPVFGKIRYMNFNGLKRKFDVQAYIDRWIERGDIATQ
jgi:deoxyribodipyrimidine photo-lyase